MKRKSFGLIAILVLTLTISLHLYGKSVGAQELKGITLAMHWVTPYAGWSGFYAAKDLGYYREEGLNIKFMLVSGSGMVTQLVGARKTDMGVAAGNTVLTARSKGVPLTVVSAYTQQTPEVILSLKEENLTKPEDFVGKIVSTSAVDPATALFVSKLKRSGVDPSKVKILNVDPQAKLSTMLMGKANASMGYIDFQAIQIKRQGKEYNVMRLNEEGQRIYGPVIIANDDYLKDNKQYIKPLLRATVKGYLYARANVDNMVNLLRVHHPEADPAFTKETLIVTLSLLNSDNVEKYGFGYQDKDDWSKLQDSLFEGGLIKEKIDVEKVFTNEFLPENAKHW